MLEITASIFQSASRYFLIHQRTELGISMSSKRKTELHTALSAVLSNDLGSVTKHMPITPYTVEPGYNDSSLWDTPSITSDILLPIDCSRLIITLYSSAITTAVYVTPRL